jgi:hypothetical protein
MTTRKALPVGVLSPKSKFKSESGCLVQSLFLRALLPYQQEHGPPSPSMDAAAAAAGAPTPAGSTPATPAPAPISTTHATAAPTAATITTTTATTTPATATHHRAPEVEEGYQRRLGESKERSSLSAGGPLRTFTSSVFADTAVFPRSTDVDPAAGRSELPGGSSSTSTRTTTTTTTTSRGGSRRQKAKKKLAPLSAATSWYVPRRQQGARAWHKWEGEGGGGASTTSTMTCVRYGTAKLRLEHCEQEQQQRDWV